MKNKLLKKELREGAIVRAEQDRQLAEEWFDVENEVMDKPTLQISLGLIDL